MRVLLLDLDGVLRRWPPDEARAAEAIGRLPRGAIDRSAFAPERLLPVIRGDRSHESWLAEVVSDLASRFPDADVRAAVARWSASPGEVVPEVLVRVRALRAVGILVVLVTNATDRLPGDLFRLGLADALDGIVSSADVGAAKPEPEIYVAALALAGVEAGEAGFVDDHVDNVAAAEALGIRGHRYVDVAGLDDALARWGCPVPPRAP
jgi:FMN phosphatase YigB (HAD superfamily)